MHALATAPQETDGVTGWIIGIMEALGAPGAGLAVFSENLFPPIPSELILPLAGFTASQGTMSLLSVILWTTVGSVLGAVVFYYLGGFLGRDRTRAIAAKLPLVKTSDIDRTETWFTRHGTKAVFLGRMVPIFRTFVSLPAGIERMAMPTFLLYTTAGSLIWNSGLTLTGYLLGENWQAVLKYMDVLKYAVIFATLAAVCWFIVARVSKGRKTRV